MKTLEIPSDVEIEYGPSGPIWLDKSGIIVTVNNGGKEHTLEDAKQAITVFEKVAKHLPVPLLVDFTKVKHMTREAREYYSSEENSKKLKALGILTSSNIGRMVANFFIGINKVRTPVRIFNSYEEAMQWLKQYL